MINHLREYQRARRARQYARQAGTPSTLTFAEWLGILEHFNYKCAYCQVKPFYVLEHIVAIKNGGGTTATNVVPACNSCNKLKDGRYSASDAEKISKVAGSLHTFLSEHGPFKDIPKPPEQVLFRDEQLTKLMYEKRKAYKSILRI